MSISLKVPRLVQTALLLTVCLLLPACGKNKISKANYEKVTLGMSLSEVEAILGKGTKEDGGDGANVAAQVGVNMGVDLAAGPGGPPPEMYVWEKGTKKITMSFVNGKAIYKQDTGL